MSQVDPDEAYMYAQGEYEVEPNLPSRRQADKVIILNPEQRQTFELLLSQEKTRIKGELEADSDPDTLLEDSSLAWFQDTEPMTFAQWEKRIEELEATLSS